MASASTWGIDLGNRALKAVKLIREGDRFRIDAFEIIEHEQILSVAGDNKESLQKAALANFADRHQLRNATVGVSVSGVSSFARFIKLPPVEPKKIPEIIRFEAIQQIPFPLDDVEWSYQLFQEKDSPDVEVGIFAMRKDLVNQHIGLFTDLGLNVQVVQMHPLAIYNGMYYDDQLGQTTMFMDCGAENTDLVIADGETVWLRTVPIGGNNFTETLAKAFKLSFAKAEELKRNAATSKYAKQIFQAMRPVFADLVSEIQRSIGFYASVHRDARIGRIVALGSTFQLPGLQKYLQQNLQLPVEKLDAFKSLPPADAKLAANLSENVLTLAGAYGLALQAMGEAKIASSLLPERIRRLKLWQEKRKWFAAAAATFVLGTAGVFGSYALHNMGYERNQDLRSRNQETIRLATGFSSRWNSEVASKGEQLQQIRDLRGLLDYRDLWPRLTADLLAVLPPQNPDQLKTVPRAQRDMILLDAIRTQYVHNIEDVLKANSRDFAKYVKQAVVSRNVRGAPAGMDLETMMMEGTMGDPNAAANANTTRGFLITIRGTTPRNPSEAASAHLIKTVVDPLKAMTAEKALAEGKRYCVARAEVVGWNPRTSKAASNAPGGSAAIAGSSSQEADALGGELSMGATSGPLSYSRTSAAPIDPTLVIDPLKDRLFPAETIENDWTFTILVAVVLDPKPQENTEK